MSCPGIGGQNRVVFQIRKGGLTILASVPLSLFLESEVPEPLPSR